MLSILIVLKPCGTPLPPPPPTSELMAESVHGRGIQ